MIAKKRRAGETAKKNETKQAVNDLFQKVITEGRKVITEGRKVMTAVRDSLLNNEEQRARTMRVLALLDKLEKKIAGLENEIS